MKIYQLLKSFGILIYCHGEGYPVQHFPKCPLIYEGVAFFPLSIGNKENNDWEVIMESKEVVQTTPYSFEPIILSL